MAAIGLLQKITQAQAAQDTAGCIKGGKDLEKVTAAAGSGNPVVRQPDCGRPRSVQAMGGSVRKPGNGSGAELYPRVEHIAHLRRMLPAHRAWR